MPLALMSNYTIKEAKKILIITWQPQQYLVSLLRYFKLCFCTQGLENPKEIGKYCSVSNIQQVSVFVLTSRLTKLYALMVGLAHEYKSLTANNVRRLFLYGFLGTRSPILKVKVESIPSIVSMQLFYKFPLSLIANLDPTGCSIKRYVIGVLCVQILCSIGLCVFS